MIKAILACDKGGVSKNGTIPWPKNKKDLGWFKHHKQRGCNGLEKWIDPLMPWPLPNRINVLATSRKSFLEQINIFAETLMLNLNP